jgi:hypothetical protein
VLYIESKIKGLHLNSPPGGVIDKILKLAIGQVDWEKESKKHFKNNFIKGFVFVISK